MESFFISLKLSADFDSYDDEVLLEKNYQSFFKPILTFLYSHENFLLTIEFTGYQLHYYSRKHPESIDLLRELYGRKQIEILGSGYYNPVFPILFPVDRSGQIEKMTSELRSSTGKRPYGMYLFGSIWDPSLITTIQSCGLEYIVLDSTLIPRKNLNCYPLIVSEQGKSVKILPVHKELSPAQTEPYEAWKDRVGKFFTRNADKKTVRGNSDAPIACVPFSLEKLEALISVSFFNNLDYSKLALPHNYFRTCRAYFSSYIPAGMEWDIAQWSLEPFVQTENNSHFPLTIYDYLNLYPQNRRLYERMMYVSLLVNQCKGGDKMRKNAAREELWKAQSGGSYISLYLGLPAVAKNRQMAFRLLNEAEKNIRESQNEMVESLGSYDYDNDGLNEYVAKMEKFQAVVSLKSGQISEFNGIRSSANYTASLSRLDKFENFEDGYNRGFFIEHLIDESSFSSLVSSAVTSPFFSKVQFTEKKFVPKRNEIHLEGTGLFMQKIPVLLKKNYTFSSTGITVQYIVRNDSNSDLKGIFSCELNFAQTRFEKNFSKDSQYSLEVILNGKHEEFSGDKSIDSRAGLSYLQIKDSADKKAFVIEPNEECGIATSMILFRRPDTSLEPTETSKTLCANMFWNIDLSAGMETERTVNLTFVDMKK
ncbi:MAG: alpha-amylase/4-alpha-glucanotransferase domain-containing protein [Treponema sp.]|nr:alpha-amylase/4-alpha-glucanotransferase domain-containing protein [Treponema sp.]